MFNEFPTDLDLSLFDDDMSTLKNSFASYERTNTDTDIMQEKRAYELLEVAAALNSAPAESTAPDHDTLTNLDTWRLDQAWLPAVLNVTEKCEEESEKASSTDDDIAYEPSPPKKVKTLNLTEEQKRLRRKDLNRLAAQRCRSKRKSRAELLEQEAEVLVEKNAELKKKLDDLTDKKEQLYDIIKVHFQSCHGSPK